MEQLYYFQTHQRALHRDVFNAENQPMLTLTVVDAYVINQTV